MMVPKRSLLVASAALLCLGTVASAQSKHTQKIRRVTKPLIQADLDLSTGKYTIGSQVNKKGAATFNTGRTLSNVDFSGFVGIDSVQCEWIDETDKGSTPNTGGRSEIMTSFLFAYCSSARATNSGGVGGSATISFLEGYSTSSGARPSFGSRTAVYNLSGLPANTADSSFFGGFNCFFIRVRTATPNTTPAFIFDGGQALADGVVGWGWDFRDISISPPLSHTFPFLACVQSCSGVGPDGQAMTDGVDQYCGAYPQNPPFNLFASFTFGTTTTFTSHSMEIREANKILAANTIYNPNGPAGTNPVTLVQAVGSPTLGALLGHSLNCTGAAPKPAIFRFEFLPGNVPPSTIPQGNGNLLISLVGAVGRNFIKPNHGGGITSLNLPLPVDLQFLNACYQVQAYCGDNPKGQLSNGLNQTVGSH